MGVKHTILPFELAEEQSKKAAKQAAYHFYYGEQALEESVQKESAELSIAAALTSIAFSLILLRGGTDD